MVLGLGLAGKERNIGFSFRPFRRFVPATAYIFSLSSMMKFRGEDTTVLAVTFPSAGVHYDTPPRS